MEILGIFENDDGGSCDFCQEDKKESVEIKIRNRIKYICFDCICSLWGFIKTKDELKNKTLKTHIQFVEKKQVIRQQPDTGYPYIRINIPGTGNPIPYQLPQTGDPPPEFTHPTWTA